MGDLVKRLRATGGKGQGGPLKAEAAERIAELEAEVERLTEQKNNACLDRDGKWIRAERLREALEGTLAITDRNHVAWDKARAALSEKEPTDVS